MNRESMTELIVARGAATRGQLREKPVQEIEKILDASLLAEIRANAAQSPAALEAQQRLADIQADRQRQAEENMLSVILRTPVNGKIAIDNIANRNIILGWKDETRDEVISPRWFVQVLQQNPGLVNQLSWQSADVLDPAKRRQAEAAKDAEERRVFHEFCRDNGFSEVTANFLLAKSVLGSFDQYTLAQAVQSNALSLAQALPEELEQFRQQAIEIHNLRLSTMDVPSLRKLARENGARIAQAPAPQLDESQRIRQAERNDGINYPPLPDEFRDGSGPEEVLNAQFVKKCSKETLRLLIKRFGSDQINNLLQNRVAGSIWEV